MRINEIITELFNQSTVPFNWARQTAASAMAKFTVGKIPYKFMAYEVDNGTWDVEFSIDHVYAKSHGLSTVGVTATGNAAVVMSTVVSIMKEFLAAYVGKIQVLVFSAEESSRQALYARMVQRLLPKWVMQQDQKSFTLSRPATDVRESTEPRIATSLVGDNGTKIEIPGGYIDIQHTGLKYAPRSQSVVDFVVEPEARGQGVGTQLLKLATQQFDDIGAQVSSPASVRVFYNAGFRNPSIPDGTFEDHERMRQEDSSVFMAQNPSNVSESINEADDLFSGVIPGINYAPTSMMVPTEIDNMARQKQNIRWYVEDNPGKTPEDWARWILKFKNGKLNYQPVPVDWDSSGYDIKLRIRDGHHRWMSAQILNIPLRVAITAYQVSQSDIEYLADEIKEAGINPKTGKQT